MGRKLQDLVRKVIAGSLSSLAITGINAGIETSHADSIYENPSASHDRFIENKSDLKPKLLLRLNNASDDWTYVSHRSHRSHSSHSSHRSHYSSRTSSPPKNTTPPPSPSTSTTTKPSTSNQVNPRSLGSRILKRADSGTDVAELCRILINKGYLTERPVSSAATFTAEVENAVKMFQRNNKLEQTGTVTPILTVLLKENSGRELGSRTLKVGMEGEDVAELIRLLIKHGYIQERLVTSKEKFTVEVENALKRFQKTNNMNETGIADPPTIVLLRFL